MKPSAAAFASSMRNLSFAVLAAIGLASPALGQTVEYYHLDAVGSVRAVTNASGAIVERHDYLPFGEEVDPSAGTNPRQFTGHERDVETGLDYFGARYYAGRTGRFTTVDPVITLEENLIDPQRWNRYVYARSNPLKYTDPDGRWIETLWDLANFTMGATSAVSNFRAGNIGSGVVDAAGAVVDLAAAVVPVVPGGVSTAIRASRGVGKATNVVGASGTAAKTTANVAGAAAVPGNRGPSFIAAADGSVFPVPRGATGPLPTRAPGMQFTGGSGGYGLDPRVTGVRFMDANANQGARAVYMNQAGQTVNPFSGRTVPYSDPTAHFFFNPKPQ